MPQPTSTMRRGVQPVQSSTRWGKGFEREGAETSLKTSSGGMPRHAVGETAAGDRGN
ncbi:maltose O-acetyltransferase [Anopheles sinensis]|uniref:Maltose O-acetyltransferase n=1 Tax=Anopheles sinensis TaxID=74873 RepID=A0A084VTG3_ANOSI|nr:maltose O-acetyltransferase [Anopheles sinensis]